MTTILKPDKKYLAKMLEVTGSHRRPPAYFDTLITDDQSCLHIIYNYFVTPL